MGWYAKECVNPYTTRKDNSWNPSGLIEDAWLVVERMREVGWLPVISAGKPGWVVEFHDKGWTKRHTVWDEESLPRAVCLAAIKAMEAKP